MLSWCVTASLGQVEHHVLSSRHLHTLSLEAAFTEHAVRYHYAQPCAACEGSDGQSQRLLQRVIYGSCHACIDSRAEDEGLQ